MIVSRLFGAVALMSVALLATSQSAWAQPFGVLESHQDIGENPQRGSAEFDAATATYTLRGGGYDMWYDVDAFRFAWKKMSGDVAIQADIDFLPDGAHPRRKAVLMVRQSLDAGSAYVDAALHADGMVAIQRRATRLGETEQVIATPTFLTRVRLERRGDRFTMFVGQPGAELAEADSFEVSLEGDVYVGLGMCSHDAAVVETAKFSNVTIETEF